MSSLFRRLRGGVVPGSRSAPRGAVRGPPPVSRGRRQATLATIPAHALSCLSLPLSLSLCSPALPLSRLARSVCSSVHWRFRQLGGARRAPTRLASDDRGDSRNHPPHASGLSLGLCVRPRARASTPSSRFTRACSRAHSSSSRTVRAVVCAIWVGRDAPQTRLASGNRGDSRNPSPHAPGLSLGLCVMFLLSFSALYAHVFDAGIRPRLVLCSLSFALALWGVTTPNSRRDTNSRRDRRL